MKKINTYFIIAVLCLFSTLPFYGQDVTLHLKGYNQKQDSILNSHLLITTYKNDSLLNKAILKLSNTLKKKGYFTNTVDSIVKQKTNRTAYFKLNKKIDSIYIKDTTGKTIKLLPEKLEHYLTSKEDALEKKGFAFSKLQLSHFKIKNNILLAELNIKSDKKRTIDSSIVKGYQKFPKPFLKHYLKLNKKTIFNKEKIKTVSELTNSLNFVKELKAPELLFTKDSTLLYLYIKKQSNSNFDGLINFSTEENNKLQFNGHLNLHLSNFFNKGETIKIRWNSLNKERQELLINNKIPYIFSSKFSTDVEFSIYKQDSSFINTAFKALIDYPLTSNTNIAISFTTENSENLNNIDSLATFKSNFIGLGYTKTIINNNNAGSPKFYLSLNPSFGVRKIAQQNTNQFKLQGALNLTVKINKRNSLFLKNTFGTLQSDNYTFNELFRIGGLQSIRGFLEQSIYTQQFAIQNIEYRYKTGLASYFYTITDFALAKTNTNNQKLSGLGLGFLFRSNNTQINLSSTIGATINNTTSFNTPQLNVIWKNYF